jgi:hypothetical protein
MTSVNARVPVVIMLPASQERAFVKGLVDNWEVVDAALGSIDSRNASASVQADLDLIRGKVERSVGFGGLNTLAKREMRAWLEATAAAGEPTLSSRSPEPDFPRSRLAPLNQ